MKKTNAYEDSVKLKEVGYSSDVHAVSTKTFKSRKVYVVLNHSHKASARAADVNPDGEEVILSV